MRSVGLGSLFFSLSLTCLQSWASESRVWGVAPAYRELVWCQVLLALNCCPYRTHIPLKFLSIYRHALTQTFFTQKGGMRSKAPRWKAAPAGARSREAGLQLLWLGFNIL